MKDISVIILASGSGKRFGAEIPKQFLDYKGKPLLEWSIIFFDKLESVKEIILVVSEEYINKLGSLFAIEKYPKVKHLVLGGATRQLSSFNGLKLVSFEYVLIHDAARPNLSLGMVDRIINELDNSSVVVPCINSSNTIYQLDKENIVKQVLDRNNLGIVQTPQAFRTNIIKEAHSKALQENKTDFTDDAGMIIYYKQGEVKAVKGEEDNIKVTFKSDL